MKFDHVLMGDTDSTYARLDLYAARHNIPMDREQAVKLADGLQKMLQTDIPHILSKKFLSPASNFDMLEPGRETVGRRALFKDKKKRYAIHVVDDEGYPADKVKIMGMETRRSDTPKFIQAFLEECITEVVKNDADFDHIRDIVEEFRADFIQLDPWRQGSPGRVKNVVTMTQAHNDWLAMVRDGHFGMTKPRIHYICKAAINTNILMAENDEKRWDMLRDGDKIEVIYLKTNEDKIESVAIRTGESYVPDWFKKLPFDQVRMETKLVDQKMFNTVGDIMGWDFTPPKTYADEVMETVDDWYD